MHLFANMKDWLEPPPLRRDPVFIVGVHRSGTSALSGALSSLGLSVGKSVMPPGPDNPKGYYENRAIAKFHDEFLTDIGDCWHSARPVDPKHFHGERAKKFQKELIDLLRAEFGKTERPLIKDPRLCQLLPLWIPVIHRHFSRATFLLPMRHPLEVGLSLKKRDRFTLEHGLAIWCTGSLEAERATRGFRRFFTTYEDLLKDPLNTVGKLAQQLKLPANDVAASVPRLVDPALRHHENAVWPEGEKHKEFSLLIYKTMLAQRWTMKHRLNSLRDHYYKTREVLV
jgi:hypothetical protein